MWKSSASRAPAPGSKWPARGQTYWRGILVAPRRYVDCQYHEGKWIGGKPMKRTMDVEIVAVNGSEANDC